METTAYPSPEHSEIVLFCDGICEPNPGTACWAWIAFYKCKAIAQDNGTVGYATNNVAEYSSIIRALEWCNHYHERINARGLQVIIKSDSRLVVEQVNGCRACNAPALQPLCKRAQALLAQLSAELRWIPREQNERADALSRRAYVEARRARAASQRKAVL